MAETPCNVTESSKNGLWEAVGWKEFVEHMPSYKQPIVAVMLENCRAMFSNMNESTRPTSLGTFDKWIFPIIANMAENDVIDQLVALQPMAGPVSQIVMGCPVFQEEAAEPVEGLVVLVEPVVDSPHAGAGGERRRRRAAEKLAIRSPHSVQHRR